MAKNEFNKSDTIAFDMIGNVKSSSLYFDWVIPANPLVVDDDYFDELGYYKSLLPDVFPGLKCDESGKPLDKDAFGRLFKKDKIQKRMDDYDQGQLEFASDLTERLRDAQFFAGEDLRSKIDMSDGKLLFLINFHLMSEIYKGLMGGFESVAKDFIGGYFADLNLCFGNRQNDLTTGPAILYPSQTNDMFRDDYDCAMFSLSQLQLIDTTNASWEYILKFREDVESLRKLRRLMFFFHEDYSGEEKRGIQHDLLHCVEDYNNVVDVWGFDTVTSSIQMLLASPVTSTSIGASLAMGLFGEPLAALASSGSGVGLEIDKVSLRIKKEKKKLSVLQKDYSLAYIFAPVNQMGT